MNTIEVTWQQREPPLTPLAVVVFEPEIAAVNTRLKDLPPELQSPLKIVRFEGGVVLLSEPDTLPWIERGVYLGQDPCAQGLLLPTLLQPSVSVDLFEQALRNQVDQPRHKLAVLPQQNLVVALGSIAPITAPGLLTWCAPATS